MHHAVKVFFLVFRVFFFGCLIWFLLVLLPLGFIITGDHGQGLMWASRGQKYIIRQANAERTNSKERKIRKFISKKVLTGP